MPFLIESALLVHGLPGVSNDAIAEAFGSDPVRIVWLEKGRVRIGGLESFLDFRAQVKDSVRVNHFNLEQMAADGADGVMTASGALSIAAREGIKTAVTAGIGGFFPNMLKEADGWLVCGGKIPPDVATLLELPVTLVSSGPKDMLDYAGTCRYLAQNGVEVRGLTRSCYSGYLFIGEETELPDWRQDISYRSSLIINEIPEEKRIADRSVLNRAVSYAMEAQAHGAYYHPAVNRKIEELTGGYSASVQLEALAANARSV